MEKDGKRSSNDQKSDASNPTSSEHKSVKNNRSDQMKPNNPEYQKSREKK